MAVVVSKEHDDVVVSKENVDDENDSVTAVDSDDETGDMGEDGCLVRAAIG